MSHISDDCLITDLNMKFGEFKTTRDYQQHVEKSLRSVSGGQHLRFINSLYRTREVCVAAVSYELRNNVILYDVYCVPKIILKDVLTEVITGYPHLHSKLPSEFQELVIIT